MTLKPSLALSIAFLAVACSSPKTTTAEPAAPAKPSLSVEQRNAELVQQHNEIWKLMELSPAATDELNAIVVAVNTQMDRNRHEKPAAFAAAMEVKRVQGELTHEEYIASHQKRFGALGISPSTQAELMAAAEFVWTALHDPNVPAEKKQTAETIQAMMKSLNGPPPCCDDNIFQRAAS